MRRGVRLGIDVGSVRIGIARSDPDGILATPMATVSRGTGDLDKIIALVDSIGAVEVVVGDPLHLSGAAGASAKDARDFAGALAERLDGRLDDCRGQRPEDHIADNAGDGTADRSADQLEGGPCRVSVRLVDERLSTVTASAGLRAAGRTTRQTRSVIDRSAAVIILQSALDAERTRGEPPGRLVQGRR